MADAGIVGGEYEFGLVFFLFDPFEGALHGSDVLDSGLDAFFGVFFFSRRHSQSACGGRHELHQSPRSGP